jgi:hypothetical protein
LIGINQLGDSRFLINPAIFEINNHEDHLIMKIIAAFAGCLFINSLFAQTTVESKRYGSLQ